MADDKGHSAGTEVPGGAAHEGGAFPPFDATTFAPQLIWLVITFGALYLLMSRLALPRVAQILETRQARISGDLEQANAMRAKVDATAAAYEETLANAKAQATITAQKVRDQIAADAIAQRKTLQGELSAKLAAAEARIHDAKVHAMENVGEIASDAAADIVQHITGHSPEYSQLKAAIAAATKI